MLLNCVLIKFLSVSKIMLISMTIEDIIGKAIASHKVYK